jgi:putative tryptophan/tyrosine transport system substrate-binding protein
MRIWAARSEMIDGRLPFIVTITLIILAAAFIADAQEPPKIYRIGLQVVSPRDLNATRIETFRQGLRELGYVEGKNVMIEYRYAEGKLDLLPSLASELVQQQVDVIVTVGTPGVLAAKNATRMIPIVFVSVSDPVANGVVASLARPGGNVTGLSILAPELSRKRLELLKEAFPKVTRVVVLWNPTSSGESLSFMETQGVAKALGVQLHSMEVRGASDFESGFQRARKASVQALVTLPSPVVNSNLKQVLEFAAKNRLPAMYFTSEFVDAGGLMSYAPNFTDQFRRAATYVDKILKGRKPADLPVEQPTKFEFIINLKAAKQIDVTIPQSVLYRADKVIR